MSIFFGGAGENAFPRGCWGKIIKRRMRKERNMKKKRKITGKCQVKGAVL
jgi:hypothetical protein